MRKFPRILRGDLKRWEKPPKYEDRDPKITGKCPKTWRGNPKIFSDSQMGRKAPRIGKE